MISKQSSDAELEALGVSYGAQILLDNYNFGLDERIDAQMLSDVAAYAKEHVDGTRDWSADFKEKLLHYRYRSFHSGDAPYNFLVIFGYGTNLIAAVILSRRDIRNLAAAGAQLFLILAVRSALWLFVLMRGRDPERITHPLYLVEFCLLAGVFLQCLQRGMYFVGNMPERVDSPAPFAVSLTKPSVSGTRSIGFKTAQSILPIAGVALFFLCLWFFSL